MRKVAGSIWDARYGHRRHSTNRKRGLLFWQQFNLCVGAIILMNAARLRQSWFLLREKCIFVKLMMNGRLFFSRELSIATATFLIKKREQSGFMLTGTGAAIIRRVARCQDIACSQQGS
jgi:hypothetical protein